MSNANIRGVSIHTTGEGLAYYIHYDELGTVRVEKKAYEEAITSLEKWDLFIERKKKEMMAMKLS